MIPNALTIAGSDSGAGAGIQADLKTFAALGVYGASVITALTAQNTKGVSAIHDAPVDFVTAQIDAVCSDLEIKAVKIGMLSNAALIGAVADGIKRHRLKPVVLDPVMVATSGDRLLKQEAVSALVKRLFPLASLITPNLHEAAALLDVPMAASEEQMAEQGKALITLGAKAVLMKGGHGEGAEAVDLLVTPKAIERFAAPRLDTPNTHGTGCTLSSAIAAHLAKGLALPQAVGLAKIYLHAALAQSTRLSVGHGHGPVHHFYGFY